MQKTLNITNGDSAVNIMREAGIEGDFLPWRDLLHVGPVPARLSFEALSEVRAEYIVSQGWGDSFEVDRMFQERLALMNHIEKYERVILWFEHDLFDQLQLLEILHWFATHSYAGVLTMVCTEHYLGRCSVEEMKALKTYESPVTAAQLNLAVKAWDAFRSASPELWCSLLDEETSALPFLEGAILRMLQEYPSCENGLSKTQQDILQLLIQGEMDLVALFIAQQACEERVFMADTVFTDILNEMAECDKPLLTSLSGERFTFPLSKGNIAKITEEGLAVLSGEKHWWEIHSIDKWLGGVHLSQNNLWCWHDAVKQIEKKG